MANIRMNIEEHLKSDDKEIVEMYAKIYLQDHSLEELNKELNDSIYEIYSTNPLVLERNIFKLILKTHKRLIEDIKK